MSRLDEQMSMLRDELARIEASRALRPASAPEYPTVRELAATLGFPVERTHAALTRLRRAGEVTIHRGWGLVPGLAQEAIRAAAEREHRLAVEAAHYRLPGQVRDAELRPLGEHRPVGPLHLRREFGSAIVKTFEPEPGVYLTQLVRVLGWTTDGAGQPVMDVDVEEESEQHDADEARAAFAAMCEAAEERYPF